MTERTLKIGGFRRTGHRNGDEAKRALSTGLAWIYGQPCGAGLVTRATSKYIAALVLIMGCIDASPADLQKPVDPAVAAGERGTRLVLLGTGAGDVIRATRSQPSSLMVVDGRPYLFDCGEGTVRQLKKVGFEANDIARVFLTHLHFDHTAGLASLIAFNWGSGTPRPVEVFGPPGTQSLTSSAISYFSISADLFTPQLPPRPRMSDLGHGHDLAITTQQVVYEDDRIKVTAVPNSHYTTLPLNAQPYGAVLSYSFRVVTASKVIVFTGDTGPSDAVIALAHDADILVSEIVDPDATVAYVKRHYKTTDAMLKPMLDHMAKEHLAPKEVGILAERSNVKMVVLSHIGPGEDDEKSVLNYTSGVSRVYHGPVIAGRDFDEF